MNNKESENKKIDHLTDNLYFDITQLKEPTIGEATIIFGKYGIKAKYYYGESEEIKRKKEHIKNMNNKLEDF